MSSTAIEESRDLDKLEQLLDSLGVLSHKINNPLTALMGRAQILQLKQDSDPQVRKAAEVIEESGQRIADYVRELMQVVQAGRQELLQSGSAPAPARASEKVGQHEGQD